MEKRKIKSLFLLFLSMFALSGCDNNTNNIKEISNNGITAKGEFEEGTILFYLFQQSNIII